MGVCSTPSASVETSFRDPSCTGSSLFLLACCQHFGGMSLKNSSNGAGSRMSYSIKVTLCSRAHCLVWAR